MYEGVDQRTRQRVAVKLLRSDITVSPDLLRRFVREARAVAMLSHPGIVGMLHVDVDEDGAFYQVQQLVVGEPLGDALARHGRFEVPVVAAVLSVLGDALASAHAQQIVHRDVKPANAMLTAAEPGVKLLDFGIASVAAVSGDSVLTRTGMLLGTLRYMAPEQLFGDEVGTPADVFALGVVGWEMLCGDSPFGTGLHREVRSRPPELERAPEELRALLLAMLQVNPMVRPVAADVAVRLGPLVASDLTERVAHDALGPLLGRPVRSGDTTVMD